MARTSGYELATGRPYPIAIVLQRQHPAACGGDHSLHEKNLEPGLRFLHKLCYALYLHQALEDV
jgi:hypothetical protein